MSEEAYRKIALYEQAQKRHLRNRLRAMRAALKKLARLEYVDPGDAQDILDEDDRRRRGR